MISRVLSGFLLTGVCLGLATGVTAAPISGQGRTTGFREALEERGFQRSALDEYRTNVESIDFDALRLQAKQGDADAQFKLGEAFWRGFGVGIDYERAHHWLSKAAAQQHVDALVPLAVMYERGHYDIADPKRAAELYFEASQQGDDWALAQLARLYIGGEGVRQDVRYGLKLLHQLADLEHYAALVYLGDYAEEGLEGEAPDYQKAAEYFERARGAGSEIASSRLADLIYTGRLGDVDMERVFALLDEELNRGSFNAALSLAQIYLDGVQVPKDAKKALEYYELAADWGSSYALLEIGELYEEGALGEVNYKRAADYYQLARERGDGNGAAYLGYLKRFLYPEDVDPSEVITLLEESVTRGAYSGMVALGDCYRDGYGVEMDHLKANAFYQMAVEAGSSFALVRLGNAYDEGLGVEVDYAKALQLYQKAVDAGDGQASADLGFLYEQGYGTEKDQAKAREFYEKGSEAGSAFGAYRLGLIFYYGDGAEQDYSQSLKQFHTAARRGNESATVYLGYHYHYGQGVAADPFEARYWYEHALSIGIESVKMSLAYIEEDGLGGPRNLSRAKQLYRESSASDPDAQFELARLEADDDPSGDHLWAFEEVAKKGSKAAQLRAIHHYMYGGERVQDLERAEKLLLDLAADEYAEAYVYLGILYDEMIVDRAGTPDEAVKWLSKAAHYGNIFAARRLALKYEQGDQVEASNEKFVYWRQILGLNGEPRAALDAAYELEYSRIDQDMKLQEQLYTIAANAGELVAQLRLAKKYIFGSEYPGDYERGVALLREAVRLHGGTQAYRITTSLSGGIPLHEMLKLEDGYSRDWDRKVLTAINLVHGITVPKNAEIAEKLIRSAPDRWEFSPEARYTLATLIFAKENPSTDEVEEALQELTITANSGYVSGQRKLAELYEQGRYVEQDYRKAALWYRIAGSKVPSVKVHVARLILDGKVTPNYGEDALGILSEAAEIRNALAVETLVNYWAEQAPNGYEHIRWLRRQKQLSMASS